MGGKHLAPATELTRAMEAAADDWAAVFVGKEMEWTPKGGGTPVPVVVRGFRLEFPVDALDKARFRIIARVPSLLGTAEVAPGRLKELRTDG